MLNVPPPPKKMEGNFLVWWVTISWCEGQRWAETTWTHGSLLPPMLGNDPAEALWSAGVVFKCAVWINDGFSQALSAASAGFVVLCGWFFLAHHLRYRCCPHATFCWLRLNSNVPPTANAPHSLYILDLLERSAQTSAKCLNNDFSTLNPRHAELRLFQMQNCA